MRTLRWLLIGLLASLVVVSCGQEDTMTAEQIMDGVKQARETIRDARAVVEVVSTGTREDGRFKAETWLRKSDQTDAAGKPIAQSRIKMLETSRAEFAGAEIVNDGTSVWIFSPERNSVMTGRLQDLKQGEIGAQDPAAQMLRMQEQLQQLLDGSNVEILAENEPVAGLDAWKVKLTPKPETAQQMQLGSLIETTLWVEHERFIPLKAVVDAGELGKLEATVQQIATNQGIDPAQFSFTPPAGAEIVDASELARQARPTTTTLEEARASASFPVLAPGSLPEGVILDEVQTLSLGGETVIQNYSGPLAFSLVQTMGQDAIGDSDAPFGAKSDAVTVRGQPGTLVTGGGSEQGTFLSWQENGVKLIIAGTLTPDQAQAIAGSLK